MTVGTKSVLFGVHCPLVHTWFVAAAWWRLYGAPLDPRLWAAFAVHDLGYLGKPNMDGPEGEQHVELGARIMGIFGREWADFARYHSRFIAKQHGRPVSRLCLADKLSLALTPAWLYLPLARASGELQEYMRRAQGTGKYASAQLSTSDQHAWLAGVQAYVRQWVEEHRDGRADTWTPIVQPSEPSR